MVNAEFHVWHGDEDEDPQDESAVYAELGEEAALAAESPGLEEGYEDQAADDYYQSWDCAGLLFEVVGCEAGDGDAVEGICV